MLGTAIVSSNENGKVRLLFGLHFLCSVDQGVKLFAFTFCDFLICAFGGMVRPGDDVRLTQVETLCEYFRIVRKVTTN